MKNPIIIISLLLVALITSCKEQTKVNETKVKDNPYEGLRSLAISIKAEDLNIADSLDEKDIYGIIMDWGTEDMVITVAAFKTGDASVYISTGQALIGGGKHESINKTAKELVTIGSNYIHNIEITPSYPIANQNETIFYFLTKSGIYSKTEKSKKFETGNSEFTPLFKKANEILTEYRLISDK